MKKLIILLLILFCSSVSAEVYWSDDFDGFTSGWTPSVSGTGNRHYPWTDDETFDVSLPHNASTNDGGGIVISNYEPSTVAANLRTNANSWNGWVQYTGTITIQSDGGVDDSPVLRLRLNKHTGLGSELGIQKWLGNVDYQELYIKYRVKFGDTGDDFWWGGGWSGGNPTGGNIIWKFGRVWTGFNPIDYDKTGGQSQPVDDEDNMTMESNWRCGIWIFRWKASDWDLAENTAYFDVSNFGWETTCVSPCDSTNTARDQVDGTSWDWATYWESNSTTLGKVNNFANSGNDFDSDGSFSETQDFHEIIMYFKNRSDFDTDDGDMRIWVDGTEITDDADMRPPILASMSSDPDDYGMNFVRFGDNFNNLTELIPDDPGYMDVYIDDIIIASTLAEAQGNASDMTSTLSIGKIIDLGGAKLTLE